jgi:filamentous hemagglutinin
MPGHVKTDLLTFRASSSPYPTESGVTAAVTLFSKGDNFLYYVDDGGTERQIQVAAGGALTDIPLTDNTATAFDVHESTNSYFSADTTDGSEVVAMGNSSVGTLTARIDGNVIDLNATDDITIDAGGDGHLVVAGIATVQGATVNIGGAGNGDVLVASTGTRDITIGSANATSVDINSAHGRFQLTGGNAEITTTASGIAYITDGATRYFEANYGNQTITVSDGTNSILVGSSGITVTGNTGVTGNITVTGTVDGVDISTLAGTANGEGASQIGLEDVGTYYTGTDVEAALQEVGASLGTIPANANDLADVDTTGVADGNLLQYVASNSAFEVATPATVVGGAAIGDLSNVDGAATPTNGQVLKYNTSTSLWAPANDATLAGINDLSDVNTAGVADGSLLRYNNANSAFEITDAAGVVGAENLNTLANVNAPAPSDGQVLQYVNASSEWQAVSPPASYTDSAAVAAVEAESTLDLTGDVTIDGDLTIDMGGSGNTSGRVMVGSQSEAAETADLTGVYSVKVGTAQQVPLTAGTRVHVRVAATINRVGAPTEELFLAINMEDSGGNTGSTFATKNLGGINSHQSEVVIHATLLITDATSANSAERDHLMTGLFHADVSGTVTVGSMRNFDTGTHAPVAYSGAGLEKVNVGTAYDRIRISAESGANTQTVADHYEFNVKAVTVDFSKGE